MHPSMLYKLDMCGGTVGLNNQNILEMQILYYDIVCTIARVIEVVSSFLRRMESDY
jgi:hypothetical protein